MSVPELSVGELAEVRRFALDEPEVDDVEGMTFGMRLVVGAIAIAVVAVIGTIGLALVVAFVR